MSTLKHDLGATKTVPLRSLDAGDSDPSMDESLRRARRIDALDKAAHVAASHVRRRQAIAHSLQAAVLADEAGEPDYAAGFRTDAARMRSAVTS